MQHSTRDEHLLELISTPNNQGVLIHHGRHWNIPVDTILEADQITRRLLTSPVGSLDTYSTLSTDELHALLNHRIIRLAGCLHAIDTNQANKAHPDRYQRQTTLLEHDQILEELIVHHEPPISRHQAQSGIRATRALILTGLLDNYDFTSRKEALLVTRKITQTLATEPAPQRASNFPF